MPLRLRITPEQIQKRQEYLKKKYQQQQQGKTSEVIKNSINTLENKLQSLDFSKMFNQVSEKISSITSPVTPDKSFFYFDNDEGEVKQEEVIVKEGNVNRRYEGKTLSVATAVAAKTPATPTTPTSPTTPSSNNLGANLKPFSSNIKRSRSLLSTSPSTKMTMTSTPPFNTDINLKADDSSSPPLRRNTFSSPRRPVNNNMKGLQKKSSLTAIGTDLNSAYENASNRLSGWFKTGSSVLSNAFANINIMINDTPINEVNSNSINGNGSSINRNKRASLPPRINASPDDIQSRIQRKLADVDDNVPILKSSNASSSTTPGNKKSVRMVSSSPHLKTPSNATSDSVKTNPTEPKEGNNTTSTSTLQPPKQS